MNKNRLLHKTGSPNAKALTSLASLMMASSLFAQDNKKSALETYVIDGGPTMLLILFVILALVALVVFNFMNISKAKFCPVDLKNELMDHMTNCRVRSAIETAAAHPSYLGRMLAYALPNVDATRPEDLGRESVEDAIADFSVNDPRITCDTMFSARPTKR